MQSIAEGPERGQPDITMVRAVAQVASAVIGLVGAAAVVLIGGGLALLTGCVDGGETTALCPEHGWVASTLELFAVVAGAAASLSGGIVSSLTARARWLVGGLAVGALMIGAILLLSSGQELMQLGS